MDQSINCGDKGGVAPEEDVGPSVGPKNWTSLISFWGDASIILGVVDVAGSTGVNLAARPRLQLEKAHLDREKRSSCWVIYAR